MVAIGCSTAVPPPPEPLPPPPGVGTVILVTILPDSATAVVGDTIRFQASVYQRAADSIVWAVSDTALARVDRTGLVTARKAGDVAVRATGYRAGATASGVATLTIH